MCICSRDMVDNPPINCLPDPESGTEEGRRARADSSQPTVLPSIEYKAVGWMLVLDIVVKLGKKKERGLCCFGASLPGCKIRPGKQTRASN